MSTMKNLILILILVISFANTLHLKTSSFSDSNLASESDSDSESGKKCIPLNGLCDKSTKFSGGCCSPWFCYVSAWNKVYNGGRGQCGLNF